MKRLVFDCETGEQTTVDLTAEEEAALDALRAMPDAEVGPTLEERVAALEAAVEP